MPAKKGHQRYGNPVKNRKYTPEQIWEKACEYFQWCEDHPFHKVEQRKASVTVDNAVISSQLIEISKPRPFTMEGLCKYLNINKQTFENYTKAKGYETYFDVCSRVKEIVYEQQFCGAAIGVFNPQIVARKLGMYAKSESVKSKSNEVLQLQIVKSDEMDELKGKTPQNN
jgi:hypothetical protein